MPLDEAFAQAARSPSRALMNVPQPPNFTMPPPPQGPQAGPSVPRAPGRALMNVPQPRVPSSALVNVPQPPNFTMPPQGPQAGPPPPSRFSGLRAAMSGAVDSAVNATKAAGSSLRSGASDFFAGKPVAVPEQIKAAGRGLKSLGGGVVSNLNTIGNSLSAGDDIGMALGVDGATGVERFGATAEALGNAAGGYIADAVGRARGLLPGVAAGAANGFANFRPATAIASGLSRAFGGDGETALTNMRKLYVPGSGPASPVQAVTDRAVGSDAPQTTVKPAAPNPQGGLANEMESQNAAYQPGPSGPAGTDAGGGIRRVGNTFTNVDGATPMSAPGSYEPVSAAEANARKEANIAGMLRTAAIERQTRLGEMGLRDRGDADYYVTGAGAKPQTSADVKSYSTTWGQQWNENKKNSGMDAAGEYIAGLQSKVANNTATVGERASLADAIRTQQTTASQENVAAQNREAQMLDRQSAREIASADRAAQRDVTMRGQDMTAATAAANAKLDMMKSDRQYGLDVARYGNEQAKTRFDQRSKAEEDSRNFITSLVGPGADGKPDTAKAADYTRMLLGKMDQRMGELRMHLSQHPEDGAAVKLLKDMEDRGLASLDKKAMADFVTGQEASAIAKKASSGWMPSPFGGTAVDSTAPIKSLKLRKGLIFDDYVSDRGDVIPAREIDNQGNWIQSTPSNRFNGLKQGAPK